MNSADKGFFLAYTGDPLSKTAHSGHGMEQKSSFEIPGLVAAKEKAKDAAKKAEDAAKKAKKLWELSQSDGGDSSQEEQPTPEQPTPEQPTPEQPKQRYWPRSPRELKDKIDAIPIFAGIY